METSQPRKPKSDKALSERLRKAYNDVSPNLRPRAIRDFCEAHLIVESTFRNKISALTTVTVQECEWLEAYRPYHSQPVAA